LTISFFKIWENCIISELLQYTAEISTVN